MTHSRLSVHDVTFLGSTLDERDHHWQSLGLRRLSLIGDHLLDGGADVIQQLIDRRGYAVETITHILTSGPLATDPAGIAAARRRMSDQIDIAARLGANSLYMLTGGRGALAWSEAAQLFVETIAPCVAQARDVGVALAIENASSLYVDIHLAHSLHDTIILAEMAGVGICIDHFHCWWEAEFPDLVARAMPLTRLIQISDYAPGDRALPARAVPGDGAIPIRPFIEQALALGYAHGFDLELIGPRIAAEGALAATRRACETLSAMLDAAGA